MIGVVLCGGQSTRMGQDKGLMEFRNERWAQIVQKKLVSLRIPTVFSINSLQLSTYSKLFDSQSLVVDNSDLKLQGPLLGLLSTHMYYKDEDLLVIACDMINVDSIAIRHLVEAYEQQRSEAVAFKGVGVEPLCAIYSSRGLEKIISCYNRQTLEKNSLKYVLEVLQTIYLPIKDEWESYFKNFNHPEDIR